MGCYDTVRMMCPHCGEIIEVQSKGGKCNLETYSERRVPIGTADYIDGKKVTCESCKKESEVQVHQQFTSMSLEPVKADPDEDE